ncbi:retrovirus-related pol polyprotein from transposon TNT 1-94 [Tanacetum coccineum]
MAAEIPQTLEYRGGQLNVAPLLEVKNFTNWKKRFMCHIVGIEPQFKNIILNGPYVSMTADDQMNSGINCETTKATWKDLILYHESPSDVNENRVMDLKLCYSTFRFKEVRNQGLVAEAYEWDEEEVSSDDNEMVEVHTFLEMEDNDERKYFLNYLCVDLNFVKEQRTNLMIKHRDIVQELNTCKEKLLELKQAKLNFLTIRHENTKIPKENQTLRKELKELTEITETWLNSSNKDTSVSKLNVERPWLSKAEGFNLPNYDTNRILSTESHVNVTKSLVTVNVIDSSIIDYDSAEESTLVCSTPLPPLEKLPAETSKDVIINETNNSSAPAKGPKNVSASKRNSASSGKLKNVKTEDDIPMSVRNDHRTGGHAEYMSSRNMVQHLKTQSESSSRSQSFRPLKPFPPYKHCGINDHKYDDCVNYPICELYGSYDHDTKGHNRVISLRRGIKPRNPQHVTKSHETCGSTVHTKIDHNDIEWLRIGEALLAKKAESTNANRSNTPTKSISQLCDAKYIVQFDEKIGIILNSNKEVVMIAPKIRDVDVIDMTSSAQESCFFAKAFESLNWLWHKRLSHLNFKTINQLAKLNLVIGLPSLVYSKDKPCSSYEKRKHHRASFKTKQTSSIHMDSFGHVTPRSINHEKYTLFIVDEYSRYIWVYFLKKKSHAPETIMSDIHVKQLRTDNGTKFRNSILVNFCDENGISKNFYSPYTPEQNGVAERKNRTLIEAVRTMLSGFVFSKQYWTEAVTTAFYIHNHKGHLGKFDEKDDDGYFLGYSLVSKAFRVFNTRRQQTKETFHITFDKSTEAIKPGPVFTEAGASSNQPDQNNQPVQNDEILNDDQAEHSNHTNDEHIIDNLTNTEDVLVSRPPSSSIEDALVSNAVSTVQTETSTINSSLASPAPQDRWSRDKHI